MKPWLRKHVTQYKNMRKWMVKVLSKFQNFAFKIAPINLILITNSINLQLFTLILYGVGVCCDQIRFSVHSPLIERLCESVI